MKWIGYALQTGFYDYISLHPEVLRQLPVLSPKQQAQFVRHLDEEELRIRAITYFDNEAIYLEDHTLFYKHPLRNITYQINITPLYITLEQKEENPFYPFLKRVFRNFLIYEQEV